MIFSKDEAQRLTLDFINDYPGAVELAYRFRKDTDELYKHRAKEISPTIKGGYVPREVIYQGRLYSCWR